MIEKNNLEETYSTLVLQKFNNIYNPDNEFAGYWWGHTREDMEARIFALLLAAEIVEDEGFKEVDPFEQWFATINLHACWKEPYRRTWNASAQSLLKHLHAEIQNRIGFWK